MVPPRSIIRDRTRITCMAKDHELDMGRVRQKNVFFGVLLAFSPYSTLKMAKTLWPLPQVDEPGHSGFQRGKKVVCTLYELKSRNVV